MYFQREPTIIDFKAEKEALRKFTPEENVWKGLALWINTFIREESKRAFFEILAEDYQEATLNGG